MPISVYSPLNCQTFFKYWAFKAFSKASHDKLSNRDQCIAKVAAVLFGIGTFGIGTWICRKCLHDRKIVSQAQSLKFQEKRLEEIFGGTDEKAKAREIHSLLLKQGYVWKYGSDDFDPSTDVVYNYLKEIKTNNNFHFILNCKQHIYDNFTLYVKARALCDELNKGTENIQAKFDDVQIWLSFQTFYKLLMTYCKFETIAPYFLTVSENGKNRFIAFLSHLEFSEFREKYNCIKTISIKKNTLNPLLNIENQKSHKSLGLACEVLDALEMPDEQRDIRLQYVQNFTPSLNVWGGHLLWKLLANYCQTKDIAFLMSYSFNLHCEEIVKRKYFVEILINLPSLNKWKASLSPIWDHVDKLYLADRYGKSRATITKLFHSITNKKTFEIVFKSLCETKSTYKSAFILRCLSTYNPTLSVAQKIVCIKNVLWPTVINLIKCDTWFDPPFPYGEMMANNTFFREVYESLSKLLIQLKKHKPPLSFLSTDDTLIIPQDLNKLILNELDEDSKIAFLLASKTSYKQLSSLLIEPAKKNILELLQSIPLFNQKHQELKGSVLVDGVDNLEALIDSLNTNNQISPRVWLRLSALLELAVFDAVMLKQPFSLGVSTKTLEDIKEAFAKHLLKSHPLK